MLIIRLVFTIPGQNNTKRPKTSHRYLKVSNITSIDGIINKRATLNFK